MTDLFTWMFSYFRDSFEFVYTTYTNINIVGNASLFDFVIALLVCGAIPVVIASVFGSGLATSITSTVSKSSQVEKRKQKESKNYYKERRN